MKVTLTFELDNSFDVALLLCLHEILTHDIASETDAAIARDWVGTLADVVSEAVITVYENNLLPETDMTSKAVRALLALKNE